MNLLFRLIWTLLRSPFRKPCALLGPCVTPFITLLNDLDVLLHMNNGRYLTLLDLARLDLLIRSGLHKKIRRGYYPVVTAETIQFRKSLQLFQKFTIVTKVLGWDEKYFFLEQTFMRKNTVVALAHIQARILHKSGKPTTPAHILELINYQESSPKLPEWLQEWSVHQQILKTQIKGN
ncbi:MAG: thioesterase family protein [Gammaproteobacteria bacterium]|nr:thioesterase family protein [Gammaproteobacteria bacterium]